MDTRADLETQLKIRIMAANNSALVNSARLTSEIQNATLWAGSLYWWPSLQRARVTTALKNTQSLNYDYYDYPDDFLTDSIARLYIDGVKYEPKAYQDFLDYVDSSNEPILAPSPTNHFYATFGRQFFVYPTYSGTAPANNIIVWGNIQHPALVNPTDTTIFSKWNTSGNEAILKKAMSVILKRIEPQLAAAEEKDAVALLATMWKKVTDQMQKAQRLNHQQFNVPDYFGFGGGMSSIGNFNIPVDVQNFF